MLDKTETERLFAAARRRGFADCELFAETAYHTSIEMLPMTAGLRVENARTWTTGGLSLRGYDGTAVRQLTTRGFQLKQLLAMVEGAEADEEAPAPADLPPFTEPGRRPFADTELKVNGLLQVLRSLQALEGDGIRAPAIRWRDTIRHFSVAAADGREGGGTDESAEARVDWSVDAAGTPAVRPLRFTHSRASSSARELLALCEGRKAFLGAARTSLGLRTAWPAPGGSVPVLWGPLALAKILLQFLSAFEGDRVLGNRSFLNNLPLPTPLPFSVLDEPDLARATCDLEGSPRRQVTLFEGGRPRALAVNRQLAAQLSVPSTGHGRRDRLDASPTVGFWNASVRGAKETRGLAESLAGGLSIRDLDVKRFDAATGKISLDVTSALLVHAGAEGECVEPFRLETNLVELLRTVVAFSDVPETTGLMVEKDRQRLLTEITVPAALSEGLELPGLVPPSHYW